MVVGVAGTECIPLAIPGESAVVPLAPGEGEGVLDTFADGLRELVALGRPVPFKNVKPRVAVRLFERAEG